MDYAEAMRGRHTVRAFDGGPLPEDARRTVEERIDGWNSKLGLGMSLRTGDPKAIGAFTRMTMARNVDSYIVLAGKDCKELDERLGYAGADLVLLAQTLGLNTWWIGGTYRRGHVQKEVPGLLVLGIIAIGKGTTQGKARRSRAPAEVSRYDGERPAWFDAGVDAALLAPTALNKQAFMLEGSDGGVSLTYRKATLSEMDRGIVRFFFETGAGKDSFHWTDGWTLRSSHTPRRRRPSSPRGIPRSRRSSPSAGTWSSPWTAPSSHL